jgi:ABC-type transporter Mla subunit MlaD
VSVKSDAPLTPDARRPRPVLLGFLVVLALLIVVAATLRLREPGGPVLYADFPAAAGLRVGAPVSFRGIDVGHVTHIAFVPGGVRLTMKLIRDDVPLQQDDKVRVQPLGIFGDVGLELVPSPGEAPPLASESVLPGIGEDSAMVRQRAVQEAVFRTLARDLFKRDSSDSLRRPQSSP